MRDYTWLIVAGIIAAGIWVYRMMMSDSTSSNNTSSNQVTLTDPTNGTTSEATTAFGEFVDNIQDKIGSDGVVGAGIDAIQSIFRD